MNDLDRFFKRENDPQVDQRSALLRAISKARGRVVNACPYGCQDEELDQSGYCHHLIGFTLRGNDRMFHPIKHRPNRDGTPSEFVFSDGSDPQYVLPTDHLEPGSGSARVYRKVPVAVKSDVATSVLPTPQAAKKCKPKPKPKAKPAVETPEPSLT